MLLTLILVFWFKIGYDLFFISLKIYLKKQEPTILPGTPVSLSEDLLLRVWLYKFGQCLPLVLLHDNLSLYICIFIWSSTLQLPGYNLAKYECYIWCMSFLNSNRVWLAFELNRFVTKTVFFVLDVIMSDLWHTTVHGNDTIILTTKRDKLPMNKKKIFA